LQDADQERVRLRRGVGVDLIDLTRGDLLGTHDRDGIGAHHRPGRMFLMVAL
jgi:hypothetical protein